MQRFGVSLAQFLDVHAMLTCAGKYGAVRRGWRRSLCFGACMALRHAALYGLLASERHALLLQTLLIFGMLALLMIATRKVDGYRLSDGSARAA